MVFEKRPEHFYKWNALIPSGKYWTLVACGRTKEEVIRKVNSYVAKHPRTIVHIFENMGFVGKG